ncbi:biopolymer transport protein TolR [Paucidesulfovibrio gracilis DSM 16080]|uniref:Biopolymer transport protein TolR n=1 Tax=Paucidesulfovibrio gracilis DSM 16080 TaxID=1121449 RepID=A0A1T4WJW4_9BACT|nr:protein TolR [Paucidesulfovibrio gracilis]SKA77646.1 biopolymer transport protein TolR [Paucidesulfovibrio gracilis DSM 16080]
MGVLSGGDNDGLLAEINVTPFVDVMLVLLIIFMVTAPMLTQGVDVELPQTKAVKNLPQDQEHMVLSIDVDGSIFLDEYPVELDQLESMLAKHVTEQKKELFLRADQAVSYGLVVRVMGEAKAAGIESLGVVAEEPKPSRDGKATP